MFIEPAVGVKGVAQVPVGCMQYLHCAMLLFIGEQRYCKVTENRRNDRKNVSCAFARECAGVQIQRCADYNSVLCLRLVVALFSDFVNASPNQMKQLTDYQYALCDGAGK